MFCKHLISYSRNGENVKPVQTIVTDPTENDCNFDENYDVHSGTAKLTNSEILRNIDSKLAHLTQSQQQDLKELFSENKQLFSDVPSRTDTIIHDVDVGDAQPIKQHPYRLNPQEEYLKNEVQYLLDNDFIEPSQSNWSSPCLLVPQTRVTECVPIFASLIPSLRPTRFRFHGLTNASTRSVKPSM